MCPESHGASLKIYDHLYILRSISAFTSLQDLSGILAAATAKATAKRTTLRPQRSGDDDARAYGEAGAHSQQANVYQHASKRGARNDRALALCTGPTRGSTRPPDRQRQRRTVRNPAQLHHEVEQHNARREGKVHARGLHTVPHRPTFADAPSELDAKYDCAEETEKRAFGHQPFLDSEAAAIAVDNAVLPRPACTAARNNGPRQTDT